MRSRLKLWRNGRGGKWTCRIIWFGEGDECQNNIRLACETPTGVRQIYPRSEKEANEVWAEFRRLVEVGDLDQVWLWLGAVQTAFRKYK